MTDSTEKKADPMKVTVGVLVVFVAGWSWLFAIHDHHIPAIESDIRTLGYRLDNLKTQVEEMPVVEPTPHDWEGIAKVLEQAAGSVTIEFDGVTIMVGEEDRR